jgi:hypothetical protein
MPKIPNPWRFAEAKPDMRLPDAALGFRRTSAPPLTSLEDLGRINVTAWLYRDPKGVEGIQVNPNTTIAEIKRAFGAAPTRDAEVGFHSEGRAAEWFRVRPDLRVVQIFTERAPCAMSCAPLLRHYFPNVPTFYYYDRAAWRGSDGELTKKAGEILKTAYGL